MTVYNIFDILWFVMKRKVDTRDIDQLVGDKYLIFKIKRLIIRLRGVEDLTRITLSISLTITKKT